MAKATWKEVVLAESDHTTFVEGNHYFPPESVDHRRLRKSEATTVCGWKGTASYFDVIVDDAVNERAAWCYETPKDAAKEIAGHIAFWNGVQIDGAQRGADLGDGQSCDH